MVSNGSRRWCCQSWARERRSNLQLSACSHQVEFQLREQLRKVMTRALNAATKDAGGRGAKGNLTDDPSAVKEDCNSFIMCQNLISLLHCTCSRGSVSVRHTAFIDFFFFSSLSLRLSRLPVGQCSRPTAYCASASCFSLILNVCLFFFSNFETWKNGHDEVKQFGHDNCLENI